MPANITHNAGATYLLHQAGHPAKRIISIDRDSILYVNPQDEPCTAWMHRYEDGRIEFEFMPGFDASEPDDLHHGAQPLEPES
jgi:hypothetical protein